MQLCRSLCELEKPCLVTSHGDMQSQSETALTGETGKMGGAKGAEACGAVPSLLVLDLPALFWCDTLCSCGVPGGLGTIWGNYASLCFPVSRMRPLPTQLYLVLGDFYRNGLGNYNWQTHTTLFLLHRVTATSTSHPWALSQQGPPTILPCHSGWSLCFLNKAGNPTENSPQSCTPSLSQQSLPLCLAGALTFYLSFYPFPL